MLTLFRFAFGGLCILKTLDIATRGEPSIGLPLTVLVTILWGAAAVALTAGWHLRVAAATIGVLCGFITVASRLEMYNQHLWLMGSICAILVINVEVPTLLRAQLSVAYAFAALAKLNESFLSGNILYASAISRPVWQDVVGFEPNAALLILVSVGSIAIEGTLAWAFWFDRTRRYALILGLTFHGTMLTLMPSGALSAARLSVFSGLMLALYIPFFQTNLDAWWGQRSWSQRRSEPVSSAA